MDNQKFTLLNVTILILLFMLQLPASGQAKWIVFGKGGGISGEITGYRLYRNGNVYKGSGNSDLNFESISRIKRSAARKIIREVGSFQQVPFTHPGNIYYFIALSGKDSLVKYTWGHADFTVPDPLGTVYRSSLKTFSDLQYKPIKKSDIIK